MDTISKHTRAKPDTLGYHRDLAAVVFGPDSKSVAFLDKKIAESPNGRDEGVIAPESQVIFLLVAIESGEAEPEGL